MAGIGIITNPHSKLNKRNPRRQELLGYIAGERGRLEITNSLDDLDRVAREFRDREVSILAINGGDGTISRTLTAFIRAYREGKKPSEFSTVVLPQIAILRGGTINMLAANLGISGSPENVLVRLMEAHSTGVFRRKILINCLEVEGEFGFLFANGSSHSFLEEFYKNKTGALGSVLLLAKIIASRFFGNAFYDSLIHDCRTSLQFDQDKPFIHRTCTVLCSTVARMPLGPRLFWQNDNRLDRFQCISAITPARSAWRTMPASILIRPKASDSAKVSFSAKSLTVTSESTKGANYTLDGELFEAPDKKIKILMGPKLEFLVV